MSSKYSLSGQKLIDILKDEDLFIDASKDFNGLSFENISYNSKEISKNTLFIVKGVSFKKEYLLDAVKSGAVAYISETDYGIDIARLTVKDARRAMAYTAKAFYGYEAEKPILVGITGTKGKTTTSFFTKNAIAAAMGNCGYSSTVEMFNGKTTTPVERTTPESPEAYRLFAESVQNGCNCVVTELSSVAEKYARLDGMEFDYGIITNVAEDHISDAEHHSFEEYLGYKMKIVSKYKNAVINFDDVSCSDALKSSRNANRVLTYSANGNTAADIYAEDYVLNGIATEFTIVYPGGKKRAKIIIPGTFNVSNALAAFSICLLMGLNLDKCIESFAKTTVSGRLQLIENNGYTAYVDYAHNGVSINALIDSIKQYYPGKKIKIIIGGDGDRGINRRHDVAETAAEKCDFVYLAHQSTIKEDPFKIIKEIENYLIEFNANYTVIPDRTECIKKAVADLERDEVLLITGKGTEFDVPTENGNVYYKGDIYYTQKYMEQK